MMLLSLLPANNGTSTPYAYGSFQGDKQRDLITLAESRIRRYSLQFNPIGFWWLIDLTKRTEIKRSTNVK